MLCPEGCFGPPRYFREGHSLCEGLRHIERKQHDLFSLGGLRADYSLACLGGSAGEGLQGYTPVLEASHGHPTLNYPYTVDDFPTDHPFGISKVSGLRPRCAAQAAEFVETYDLLELPRGNEGLICLQIFFRKSDSVSDNGSLLGLAGV